jgi:hypothetical protein
MTVRCAYNERLRHDMKKTNDSANTDRIAAPF